MGYARPSPESMLHFSLRIIVNRPGSFGHDLTTITRHRDYTSACRKLNVRKNNRFFTSNNSLICTRKACHIWQLQVPPLPQYPMEFGNYYPDPDSSCKQLSCGATENDICDVYGVMWTVCGRVNGDISRLGKEMSDTYIGPKQDVAAETGPVATLCWTKAASVVGRVIAETSSGNGRAPESG